MPIEAAVEIQDISKSSRLRRGRGKREVARGMSRTFFGFVHVLS